jgi:hypothetical protein
LSGPSKIGYCSSEKALRQHRAFSLALVMSQHRFDTLSAEQRDWIMSFGKTYQGP